MTWGAFFVAMRRGVAEKASGASRRTAQQQTRSNATKATATKQPAAVKEAAKKKPPMEEWDYLVIDVSRSVATLVSLC